MFVQSIEFINAHASGNGNPSTSSGQARKAKTDISIYGQESNYTTWRLAKMNLAIRGIDGQIAHGDTFHNDRHPDLKADFILANPPFNVSDWGGGRLREDRRWQFGKPPVGNANFAWVQHIIYHLAPMGLAGFVLANGSMSSNQSGEGEIRKNIIEADLVDCMIALPGQLFYSTQIPACLWFICRDKSGKPSPAASRHPLPLGEGRGEGYRDRRGEVLFIDARKLGQLVDRTHRELTDDEIRRIADTYHAWRTYGPRSLPKGEDHYRGGFDFSGLVQTARELRKKQTPAESVMWELLRDRRLMNLKFRRQHQVGDYVVDFYCDEKKLALELDGPVHDGAERKQHDQKRDAYLQSVGLKVLRFPNEDVADNPQNVLEQIAAVATHPSPLGRGAGGEGVAVYRDLPGFCKSAKLDDIRKHGHVLTPGRYVGAEAAEEDDEPFDEKMQRLTAQVREQMAEGDKLDAAIEANLKDLGYG